MVEKKKRTSKKRKKTAGRKGSKKSVVPVVPVGASQQEIPVQAVPNALEIIPVSSKLPVPDLWGWIWPLLRATIAMSVLALVVVAGIYYGFESFYANKVLPNTYVGSIPVGGFSYDQARKALEDNFSTLEQKDFTFIVDGANYTLPFAKAGITYDFERVMQALQIRQRHDIWAALFLPTHIPTGLNINGAILTESLQQAIPSITLPPKNASIYLAQDTQGKPYFAIVPAETHRTADFDTIVQTVATMLEQGRALPVFVNTYQGVPEISDEDAYAAIRESELWLQKSISLEYSHQSKNVKVGISPAKDWQWLEFEPRDGRLVVAMNYLKWRDLLDTVILPAIEQEKEDVMVDLPVDKSRYAVVFGTRRDGYKVDQVETKRLVESTFASVGESSEPAVVTIPVHFEPGNFISSQGVDLGLKDLLGVGHSKFTGSSSARIFNVKKGLAIYNNVLLAPGEKLAFNSLLGRVTLAEGWKEELVIKEGGMKTVPEAGGGICQVSTTMYRALVDGGIKVLERRAHSYLVSYYVSDDDPMSGIDATIYPGSQDLVFVNDTGNYMLIQTDTSGVEAFIRIYGTSDGRKVELTGPVKSGWVSPPAPVLTATSSLSPGQTKITKKAHQGRTVRWTQEITRTDGTVEKNNIVSVYKAIPAEGLIGVARPSNADPSGSVTL